MGNRADAYLAVLERLLTALLTPVFANKLLYVASRTGQVYALAPSAKRARVRWVFQTEGQLHAPPSLGDRTVYVGGGDATVYAISDD